MHNVNMHIQNRKKIIEIVCWFLFPHYERNFSIIIMIYSKLCEKTHFSFPLYTKLFHLQDNLTSLLFEFKWEIISTMDHTQMYCCLVNWNCRFGLSSAFVFVWICMSISNTVHVPFSYRQSCAKAKPIYMRSTEEHTYVCMT